MVMPRKPYPTLKEYARAMEREAAFGDRRADILGQAARTVEQEGDAGRAEAMRHTCRKIRVQALLDRCRAVAASRRAEGEA